MFTKLSKSLNNRYLLSGGFIFLILFFAIGLAKNLPITGLEIFYSSLNPHSPTYIYYSENTKPEYTEEKAISSVVERVSYISWKEFFQLPDLKEKHSLRIDVDKGAKNVSLISITYYTKLFLLGSIPVYE